MFCEDYARGKHQLVVAGRAHSCPIAERSFVLSNEGAISKKVGQCEECQRLIGNVKNGCDSDVISSKAGAILLESSNIERCRSERITCMTDTLDSLTL